MAQMTARLPFLCVNNDESDGSMAVSEQSPKRDKSAEHWSWLGPSMDEAIGPPASPPEPACTSLPEWGFAIGVLMGVVSTHERSPAHLLASDPSQEPLLTASWRALTWRCRGTAGIRGDQRGSEHASSWRTEARRGCVRQAVGQQAVGRRPDHLHPLQSHHGNQCFYFSYY